MENNEMKRRKKRKAIIYYSALGVFLALAIAGSIVWMYSCGYTIGSWLAKFWPWLAIIAMMAALGGAGFFFYRSKYHGRRR